MATSTLTAPTSGRAGSPGLVGTVAACISGGMVFSALAAAFLSLRNKAGVDWVPEGVKFNNYVAVTIVFTLIMASAAAGWAVTSARIGQRRWASTGFGLAAVMAFAAVNMVWFLGKNLGPKGIAVADSPWAVTTYALFFASGVAIVIGLISSLVGLARVLGGHANGDEPQYGIAASWPLHLATASWVVTWALVYLRK